MNLENAYIFVFLPISFWIYVKIQNIVMSNGKKAIFVLCFITASAPLLFTSFPMTILVALLVFSVLFLVCIKKEAMASSIFISIGFGTAIFVIGNIALVLLQMLFVVMWGIVSFLQGKRFVYVHEIFFGFEFILGDTFVSSIPNIVWVSVAASLCIIFTYLFFRIKRLQNGFVFLQNKDTRWIGIILSIVIIVSMLFIEIFVVFEDEYSNYVTLFTMFLFTISALGIYFLVRHNITSKYNQRLKEQIIQEQAAEIKALHENNDFLSETIHKDNKRIPAMYNALFNYIKSSGNGLTAEAKTQGENILMELNDMMQERKNMMVKIQKDHKSLPSTGMARIDNILNYMLARASEKEIHFDFVLGESVKDMTESVITKQALETLLADLIENAIIAVSYSDYKRILVTMGEVDNCLEITIHDSGIPFDAEVLSNLGKVKSTTYADTGGSGIGYMTIFEILKESDASLVISEQAPVQFSFTKSVKVVFDGKEGFIVKYIENSGISTE